MGVGGREQGGEGLLTSTAKQRRQKKSLVHALWRGGFFQRSAVRFPAAGDYSGMEQPVVGAVPPSVRSFRSGRSPSLLPPAADAESRRTLWNPMDEVLKVNIQQRRVARL